MSLVSSFEVLVENDEHAFLIRNSYIITKVEYLTTLNVGTIRYDVFGQCTGCASEYVGFGCHCATLELATLADLIASSNVASSSNIIEFGPYPTLSSGTVGEQKDVAVLALDGHSRIRCKTVVASKTSHSTVTHIIAVGTGCSALGSQCPAVGDAHTIIERSVGETLIKIVTGLNGVVGMIIPLKITSCIS